MSWTAENDPWRRPSSNGGTTRRGLDFGKLMDSHVDYNLIDPKVLAVASSLMTINAQMCTNRQCSAAITSALFHLMTSNASAEEKTERKKHDSSSSQHAVVLTAQSAQDMISQHLGVNCPTLAKGVKSLRPAVSQPLQRRLDTLNKSASHIRHNGAVVDTHLLTSLQQELENIDTPTVADGPITALQCENEFFDISTTDTGIQTDDGFVACGSWEPLCSAIHLTPPKDNLNDKCKADSVHIDDFASLRASLSVVQEKPNTLEVLVARPMCAKCSWGTLSAEFNNAVAPEVTWYPCPKCGITLCSACLERHLCPD